MVVLVYNPYVWEDTGMGRYGKPFSAAVFLQAASPLGLHIFTSLAVGIRVPVLPKLTFHCIASIPLFMAAGIIGCVTELLTEF